MFFLAWDCQIDCHVSSLNTSSILAFLEYELGTRTRAWRSAPWPQNILTEMPRFSQHKMILICKCCKHTALYASCRAKIEVLDWLAHGILKKLEFKNSFKSEIVQMGCSWLCYGCQGAAQIVSMAGTISETSVPGRKKPRRIKSLAISWWDEVKQSGNILHICFIMSLYYRYIHFNILQ